MTRRVIVAGGRDFDDYPRLCDVLDHILDPGDTIVSGCAKGADSLALVYARQPENDYSTEEFPADWEKHGKAAGPIRNQEMSQVADILVAFWDGKSRGTKDMIERMARAKKEIHLYFY